MSTPASFVEDRLDTITTFLSPTPFEAEDDRRVDDLQRTSASPRSIPNDEDEHFRNHTTPPPMPEASGTTSSFSEDIKRCIDLCLSLCITVIFIGDLVADIILLVLFGIKRHPVYLGVGVFFFVLTSVLCTATFALQLRDSGGSPFRGPRLWFYTALNFPLQLTVIFYRFLICSDSCREVWSSSEVVPCEGNAQQQSREWLFAKLKLIHGLFQSAPFLILNALHILTYEDTHPVQYIAAPISFASFLLSLVLHEKAMKERCGGRHSFGLASLFAVLVYKTLMLLARITGFVNFLYFFGKWLIVLLVPHVLIVLVFLACAYKEVWRVSNYKIIVHSLYSMFAYFPLHNERRPEGEVLLYYTLFSLENVLMVSLAYGVKPAPSRHVHPHHLPGSPYYKAVVLLTLVGTAAGLCFMSLYYFVFHKSRRSIREANIGWLLRLLENGARHLRRRTGALLTPAQNGRRTLPGFAGGAQRQSDSTDSLRLYVEGDAAPGDIPASSGEGAGGQFLYRRAFGSGGYRSVGRSAGQGRSETSQTGNRATNSSLTVASLAMSGIRGGADETDPEREGMLTGVLTGELTGAHSSKGAGTDKKGYFVSSHSFTGGDFSGTTGTNYTSANRPSVLEGHADIADCVDEDEGTDPPLDLNGRLTIMT